MFTLANGTQVFVDMTQQGLLDNITTLMCDGVVVGYKSRKSPIKTFRIKRTKLLQSKSKQSRIVSVVCK